MSEIVMTAALSDISNNLKSLQCKIRAKIFQIEYLYIDVKFILYCKGRDVWGM